VLVERYAGSEDPSWGWGKLGKPTGVRQGLGCLERVAWQQPSWTRKKSLAMKNNMRDSFKTERQGMPDTWVKGSCARVRMWPTTASAPWGPLPRVHAKLFRATLKNRSQGLARRSGGSRRRP